MSDYKCDACGEEYQQSTIGRSISESIVLLDAQKAVDKICVYTEGFEPGAKIFYHMKDEEVKE